MTTLEDLRYPIGRFSARPSLTREEQKECIRLISAVPGRVRKAVEGLTNRQLETPYREGGWTVRQVVHHIPDSHLNAYIRLRWTLTEDNPTIKVYDQDRWSQLYDSKHAPVEVSLQLLEAVHTRWVMLLKSMRPEEFSKRFRHPEAGEVDLNWLVQMYSWHGRHHVAHIENLRKRMGWEHRQTSRAARSRSTRPRARKTSGR